MKTGIVTWLFMVFVGSLAAVAAYPGLIDFIQPDGSHLDIYLKGDEKVSWAQSPDAYSLVFNADGFYEYAMLDSGGDMVPSGIIAKIEDQRSEQDRLWLASIPKRLAYNSSQKNIMLQIWDLNNGLPPFDPPLDLIIASRIIHHLADPIGFLGHVRKNLRKKGWFIGVIPNICYYHHRIKFLLGQFPPISGAHVNFQTGPTFEKMVVAQGFDLRQLTTPKKTIRAKFWPTVFSQDLIYVFQKSEP